LPVSYIFTGINFWKSIFTWLLVPQWKFCLLPTWQKFNSTVTILPLYSPDDCRTITVTNKYLGVKINASSFCNDPAGLAGHWVKNYVGPHPLELYTRLPGKQSPILSFVISCCRMNKTVFYCSAHAGVIFKHKTDFWRSFQILEIASEIVV